MSFIKIGHTSYAWAHCLEVYPKCLFKFTIPFASCFIMMGEVHKWGATFPKGWASLSMKEGSLFCFVCTYEIHRTRMLQIMFFGKL